MADLNISSFVIIDLDPDTNDPSGLTVGITGDTIASSVLPRNVRNVVSAVEDTSATWNEGGEPSAVGFDNWNQTLDTVSSTTDGSAFWVSAYNYSVSSWETVTTASAGWDEGGEPSAVGYSDWNSTHTDVYDISSLRDRVLNWILDGSTSLYQTSGYIFNSSGNIGDVSGSVLSISGTTRSTSGTLQSISGTTRSLSGTTQSLSGIAISISGTTLEVSGYVYNSSGNIGDISGSVLSISGTTESTSGTLQSVSGTTQSLSGIAISISGTTLEVSGYVYNSSGNIGDISGSVESISGTTQSLSGTTQSASGAIQSLSSTAGAVSGSVNDGSSSWNSTHTDVYDVSSLRNRVLNWILDGSTSLYQTSGYIFNSSGDIGDVSGSVLSISGTTESTSGTLQSVSGTTRSLSGITISISGTTLEISGYVYNGSGSIGDTSTTVESISGTTQSLSGITQSLSGTTQSLSGITQSASGSIQSLSGTVYDLSTAEGDGPSAIGYAKWNSTYTNIFDISSLRNRVLNWILDGSTSIYQTSGYVFDSSGNIGDVSSSVLSISGTIQSTSGTLQSVSGTAQSASGTLQSVSGTTRSLSGTTQSLSGITQSISGTVGTSATAFMTGSNPTASVSAITVSSCPVPAPWSFVTIIDDEQTKDTNQTGYYWGSAVGAEATLPEKTNTELSTELISWDNTGMFFTVADGGYYELICRSSVQMQSNSPAKVTFNLSSLALGGGSTSLIQKANRISAASDPEGVIIHWMGYLLGGTKVVCYISVGGGEGAVMFKGSTFTCKRIN